MAKTQKLNQNQQSTLRIVHMRVRVSLRTTVVHNTAQNSSDNVPSYPPDNHHSSDDVYWRRQKQDAQIISDCTHARTYNRFTALFPGPPG